MAPPAMAAPLMASVNEIYKCYIISASNQLELYEDNSVKEKALNKSSATIHKVGASDNITWFCPLPKTPKPMVIQGDYLFGITSLECGQTTTTNIMEEKYQGCQI